MVCTWDFLQLEERTSLEHWKFNVTDGSVQQPCPRWDFPVGTVFSFCARFPHFLKDSGIFSYMKYFGYKTQLSSVHVYFHFLNKIKEDFQNKRKVQSVLCAQFRGTHGTQQYGKGFKYELLWSYRHVNLSHLCPIHARSIDNVKHLNKLSEPETLWRECQFSIHSSVNQCFCF